MGSGLASNRSRSGWEDSGAPGAPSSTHPALALIQVSALPVLMAAMARSREGLAGLAAAGAGVAGAVLALAGSRVELAIGIGVVVACAIAARRWIGLGASIILAAAGLAATAGGLADAVAGSYARPYALGGDGPRLAGLAAILVGAPVLWLLQRRALRAAARARAHARALAVAIVTVPLAGALLAAALTPDSGPQAEPVSGFAQVGRRSGARRWTPPRTAPSPAPGRSPSTTRRSRTGPARGSVRPQPPARELGRAWRRGRVAGRDPLRGDGSARLVPARHGGRLAGRTRRARLPARQSVRLALAPARPPARSLRSR